MKRQYSKEFRLERRNFLKDPSISSKEKVRITFELIQHIHFFNENNKGKFKRFFRKNLEFFPKTYKNFNSIFSLEKIDEDIKRIYEYQITKDLGSVFRPRDYKFILYIFISLIIHLTLFYLIINMKTSLDIASLFNEIFVSILLFSFLYFIYSFGSLIFINEFFIILTRSREKGRLFLVVIDKIIWFIILVFYLVSWVLFALFMTSNLQSLSFFIQLTLVPQILWHIFTFLDRISGRNLVSYDKFFLYLTHLIILLNSRYKYSYDIPYFFKKLLDCLNQELIYSFRVRIKNQEEIESKFLRFFFTENVLNYKLVGSKLEMIYKEIKDEEISFSNHISSGFLKNIIFKLEDLSELIGKQKFEFTNITYWEKLFMRSEKNTITNKIIYPLILGIFIALPSYLISLLF